MEICAITLSYDRVSLMVDEPTEQIDLPVKNEEDKAPPSSAEPPIVNLGQTLRQIHSRYLWTLLILFGLASLITVGVVILQGVRDWYLFVGMILVIFSYLILYIKAHNHGRRILRMLSLVTVIGLLVFWDIILLDRIPARTVFVDGRIMDRAPLTTLWVPIVLLGIVGMGLLVHWLYVGGFLKRSQNLLDAKTELDEQG
jgi:hypothetical protein